MTNKILQDAENIISGERRKQYGEPNKSFSTIASLWMDYLHAKHNYPICLDREDVAMMMILLKVARNATGNSHHDNLVDICGYAALSVSS